MKNITWIILVVFIVGSCFNLGISQKNRSGFLVTVEGDTLSGVIRMANGTRSSGQIGAFVIAQPDGTEKTIETKKVAQYTTGQDTETGEKNNQYFYAKKWPHNGLRVFVHPEINGKAQLFFLPDPEKTEFKNPNKIVFVGGTEEVKADAYFISFPNTELIVRLKSENYEIALKQFLRDCPDVTAQIGKKKFRFRDLRNIIGYYNESCHD